MSGTAKEDAFFTKSNIERGLMNAFPNASRVVFDDSKVYVLQEVLLPNKRDKKMILLFWCPIKVIVVDLLQYVCLETENVILSRMNMDSIGRS